MLKQTPNKIKINRRWNVWWTGYCIDLFDSSLDAWLDQIGQAINITGKWDSLLDQAINIF